MKRSAVTIIVPSSRYSAKGRLPSLRAVASLYSATGVRFGIAFVQSVITLSHRTSRLAPTPPLRETVAYLHHFLPYNRQNCHWIGGIIIAYRQNRSIAPTGMTEVSEGARSSHTIFSVIYMKIRIFCLVAFLLLLAAPMAFAQPVQNGNDSGTDSRRGTLHRG